MPVNGGARKSSWYIVALRRHQGVMSAALTFPFGYEIIGSKLKENREGFAPGPGLWAAKRETGENPVQQPLLSLTLAKALPLG